MTDIIDTCVVIAFILESDELHNKAVNFIKNHKKPVLLTKMVKYEVHKTITKKVDNIIKMILKRFKSGSYPNNNALNEKIIIEKFQQLKSENPAYENFIGYIEKELLELLRNLKEGEERSIYILIDWASELDYAIDVKIKQIKEFITDTLPEVSREYDLEKVKDIKKALSEIRFEDEFDKNVFLELTILLFELEQINFYTFDNRFFKIANKAIELLVEHDLLTERQLCFYNLN